MSNEAETAVAPAAKRPATEYTKGVREDGREVIFAGKRKVNKETLIDESKIAMEGDIVQLSAGAVSIRMDFRNGKTRTFPLPLALLAQFAGHGGEQKYGDELASPADKPLSEDDRVSAVEDLDTEIHKGTRGRARASGGGGGSDRGFCFVAHERLTPKGP